MRYSTVNKKDLKRIITLFINSLITIYKIKSKKRKIEFKLLRVIVIIMFIDSLIIIYKIKNKKRKIEF